MNTLTIETYYDECTIRESIRNQEDADRSKHLQQMFTRGVVTERTKAEHFLVNTLGNVYPYFDTASGWGLRARNKIPAGNRVFSYGSVANNYIDHERHRIYYGRVWTFMEYYTNYGFTKDDEDFLNIFSKDMVSRLYVGTWHGYDGYDTDAYEHAKQSLRNSKNVYKLTGDMIHGMAVASEKKAVHTYQITLQPYKTLPVNRMGKGQLAFCQDEETGRVVVLGIVVEINDHRTFTMDTSNVVGSCCQNVVGKKILTKMVVDPTFVGFVVGNCPNGRPSSEQVRSKTSDIKYDWHKDGTLVSEYWKILVSKNKTRDERRLAKTILQKIGFSAFSNEPDEGTHASMVVPFIGECYDFLPEEAIPEYPTTIRTDMHPETVYVMQALAAYDIEEGEKLTWLYGEAFDRKTYQTGYPPRRTIVYKMEGKTSKKKRKRARYILDNDVDQSGGLPRVIFQYKTDAGGVHDLIIPVGKDNCRFYTFDHKAHIPEAIGTDGRCLTHNAWKPLPMYGEPVRNPRFFPPPLTRNNRFYVWQQLYSIKKKGEGDHVVTYGGIPYFRIVERHGKPSITAAKLFFRHEYFNHVLLCGSNDAFKSTKRMVQIDHIQGNKIRIALPQTIWDIRGCLVHANRESRLVVNEEIEGDRVVLTLDKAVEGWKTCYFIEYAMKRRFGLGDTIVYSLPRPYKDYIYRVSTVIRVYNRCL